MLAVAGAPCRLCYVATYTRSIPARSQYRAIKRCIFAVTWLPRGQLHWPGLSPHPREQLALRQYTRHISLSDIARVAELVDARDLKSCVPKGTCGFESHLGHSLEVASGWWRVASDRNCDSPSATSAHASPTRGISADWSPVASLASDSRLTHWHSGGKAAAACGREKRSAAPARPRRAV
jgi:hypothetical protein